MASNFNFLSEHWASLHDDAVACERQALADPRGCAFYARRSLERAIKRLYAVDPDLSKPYQENLGALIHEPTFKDALPGKLFTQVRLIHTVGNNAVHSDKPIRQYESIQVARALHMFLRWAVEIYTPGKPPTIAAFDETLIPRPAGDAAKEDKSASQLREMESKLSERDATIATTQDQLAATEAKLAELQAQIKAAKADREAAADRHAELSADATEADTRRVLIDALLKEAGWDPTAERATEYEVTGMPTPSGKGRVDYVLWGDDGKPLAIVEAKKTSVDPEAGKRQAYLYANCLEAATGQRPVVYYSNGYETWMWDDAAFGGESGDGGYPPRVVQGFATQDELRWQVSRRGERRDLSRFKPNADIAGRYYQGEAIARVTEHWSPATRQRKALLVMATGTGKTRTAIGLVDILLRAGWARRVLFLADRTALVRQARKHFKRLLPNVSTCNLCEEKDESSAKLVFSTYPTIMNQIDNARADGVKRFGPSHFDLVIVDEAHRSIYQKYRGIFMYFDSLLLGLTATPRDQVDRNTYRLFDLEAGVPTYAYELEQAVADGFLVPPKAVSVPLKFMREGVSYDDLPEDEREEYETKLADPETGELPDRVDPPALNQWLFNEDTVDKALAHLMERGLKIEGGDKLGKTIIFAKNRQHAQFIERRFNQHYPEKSGTFLQVIDYTTQFADNLIDNFGVAANEPTIAVSVDMLDTGIDVPEVVNLVFFKLVRSKIKFWQMIGRGTRLCPDLFGPDDHKSHFMVFDYCQNLEFFSANPEGVEGGMQVAVSTRVFRRRIDIARAIGDLGEVPEGHSHARASVLDALHETIGRMNVDNFLVRPHRRLIERFRSREAWDEFGHADEAELREHIAALPAHDDDDELARRFDLLLLNLQLAVVEDDPKQADYQQRVHDLAAGMELKRAIPAVAARLEVIQAVQSDDWWEGVTLPMLEQVRVDLRSLVQFIDPGTGRGHVYTDFADTLGEERTVDNLIQADASLANYRLKVERVIRDHQDHVTVQRLIRNEPISATDLLGLEELLWRETGVESHEQFVEHVGTDEPLGLLVRRICGLDRNAAKQAFADFLQAGTLSADQITYLNLIIDRVCRNGYVEPEELFESPFTDHHTDGVAGVLPDHAQAIIARLQAVNQTAQAIGE